MFGTRSGFHSGRARALMNEEGEAVSHGDCGTPTSSEPSAPFWDDEKDSVSPKLRLVAGNEAQEEIDAIHVT